MVRPAFLHIIQFGIGMAILDYGYPLGSRLLGWGFLTLEHSYLWLYGQRVGN